MTAGDARGGPDGAIVLATPDEPVVVSRLVLGHVAAALVALVVAAVGTAYAARSVLGDAAVAREAWLRLVPWTAGAVLVVVVLQVPIAISLTRRLRRVQAHRESLVRDALAVADEERRRIAADLHDGVVQDLAGVAFSLGALVRDPTRPAGAATEIRRAADGVRDAVRSLRSLLVEIYPPNLASEGLEPALSDLLARVEARGVLGSLTIDAPADRLDLERSKLVYRVAQEGLRNVLHHSGAHAVLVALTATDDGVCLEVADDGRGVAGDEVPDRPGHLGIRALAEHAADLGAALAVRSAPGHGTVLALTVPWD